MIAIRHNASGKSAGGLIGILRRLATAWRQVAGRGRYRPERHYMRGPGPKARSGIGRRGDTKS